MALIFTTIAIVGAYIAYRSIFKDNIKKSNDTLFYIPTGANFEDIVLQLQNEDLLIDENSFIWVAQKKNYPQKIKSGCYLIKANMNNNELVNMLRGGLQNPIKLTFNNIRTKEDFSKCIAAQLEFSEEELLSLLNNDTFLLQYGLNSETALTLFLPNTYEFWWNTSAKKFIERMNQEFHKFWNKSRSSKAAAIPFSPIEVSILAAIVEEENSLSDEQPIIAGLYINRLRKGMLLQADPTLKYALGDFAIKRLLNKDKTIDSPYNTYLYAGLPPGPIRIPSIQAIEAVLNYKRHNYLYMCAKEDFSGQHNFAVSLSAHENNAQKYRNALNQKGIKR